MSASFAAKDKLAEYYAHRAREYNRVYLKPERQTDNATMKAMLKEALANHNVLEVACGTGFWTLLIAETARSVVATDINEEVLEVAKSRDYPGGCVSFVRADAYTLDGITGDFSAGFCASWFSHVPKSRRREFLTNLNAKLQPGALVVLLDNTYVKGSNNPMGQQVDAEGNTYSIRKLDDGSEWEIVKNFPDEEELRGIVAEFSDSVEYRALTYYWMLSYRLRP